MKTQETTQNVVMDDRDRRILSVLQRDGRISYRNLAALVNLSPNATAERVFRLQEAGVIRGFSVLVAPEALGYKLQAYVDVKLQAGTSMQAFEKALQKMDSERDATILTGAWDARLRVDCTDPAHLGRIIEELRSVQCVRETSSTVICAELKTSR
jgi:Lrp/AsnC family leucine-responsive transcriptional regulator